MDLKSAIHELLFLHECVVVPGFGAFVTNYKAAEISENTSMFHPPAKSVGFNPDLKTNDGILTHYLSQREHISYQECRENVEYHIDRWNNALQGKRVVRFPGIGGLFIDENDNLIFSPDLEVNYLLESYGLQSFEAKLVEKTVQPQEHHRTGFSTVSLAKKMLLATPVLIAIALIPLKTEFLQNGSPHTASFKPFSWTPKASTYTKSFDTPIKNDAKTFVLNDVAITSEKDEPEIEIAKPLTYYVIIGSFRDYDNAQKRLNLLLEKKFHAQIHTSDDGIYRVSLYTFNDITTAEKVCGTLSARGIDSYVMKK